MRSFVISFTQASFNLNCSDNVFDKPHSIHNGAPTCSIQIQRATPHHQHPRSSFAHPPPYSRLLVTPTRYQKVSLIKKKSIELLITMDVSYLSVFSCGHILYSEIPDTLKARRTNRISLEKEVQDGAQTSMKKETLSTALCDRCWISSTGAPSRDAYHPLGLKAIVNLLQDTVRVLGDRAGEQIEKAGEVVELLARVAKAYPKCQAMKPSQKEMQQFVVFASTLVGMAVLEVEAAESDKHQKPKIVYIDGQPYDLNTLGNSPYEFSHGTVDKQLRGIVPSGSSAHLYRLIKATARLNVPAHDQGVPTSAINLLKSHNLVKNTATVEAQQYLSSSSNKEDSDDEEDIDLFSFSRSFAPESTPALTKEDRLVSYFMEWRDSWNCDFCGNECFCGNLPE